MFQLAASPNKGYGPRMTWCHSKMWALHSLVPRGSTAGLAARIRAGQTVFKVPILAAPSCVVSRLAGSAIGIEASRGPVRAGRVSEQLVLAAGHVVLGK
jgi:hypothetical protein